MSTKINGKKLKMLPGRPVQAINGFFSTTCGHISYSRLYQLFGTNCSRKNQHHQ